MSELLDNALLECFGNEQVVMMLEVEMNNDDVLEFWLRGRILHLAICVAEMSLDSIDV